MKKLMSLFHNKITLLVLFSLFLSGCAFDVNIKEEENQCTEFGARTDGAWFVDAGEYIQQNNSYNILIEGVSRYLNFGSLSGSSGYGIRDNAGSMEVKDSGGSWTGFPAAGAGAPFAWTPTTSFGKNANSTSTHLLMTDGMSVSTTANIALLQLAEKTVKPERYPVFFYSSSTAWTGTTTLKIGLAQDAQTWETIKCETDTGTLNVSVYDGTNRMDLLNASTTVGTFNFSTNNSFTASESRRVDIGTPVSSPTNIHCTSKYKID